MHETLFGFARRSSNQFDLRSRGIPSRRAVEMEYHRQADQPNDKRSIEKLLLGGKTRRLPSRWPCNSQAALASQNSRRGRSAVVPSPVSQECCALALKPTRPDKYGFVVRLLSDEVFDTRRKADLLSGIHCTVARGLGVMRSAGYGWP